MNGKQHAPRLCNEPYVYLAAIVALLVPCTGNVRTLGAPPASANPQEHGADMVIVNAKIWTGAERASAASKGPGEAAALAVVGETIVAVGDDASVRAHIGPDTKVIDAHGHRVIPGITDSHTHIVEGGFQLGRLALRNVKSREEFVRAVQEAAKSKRPGQWVLGGRWSIESWENPEAPSKDWLDPVTGEVPVFLTRMDGHQALVNSVALRLAGIDSTGPKNPPGGEIRRDPRTNEPTGILKESAMDIVGDLIPEPTRNERYEAFRRAMKHANSLGVTSVHDMSESADVEVFRLACADRAMTLRVTSYLDVSNWGAVLDDVASQGLDNSMFRLAGLKGYMDGSLGSRTAYMREPYADAGQHARYPRGQLAAMADPPESFRNQIVWADARGVQLAVHAIGDQANHLLLRAYKAAVKMNGFHDARHRIEHAQHLLVPDIALFDRLGVVASMQPFHKADDGGYAEKALGKDRLAGSYAFRQLLDAGALLCFGSDWPVATLDPFAGVAAAVNARTLAGDVWLASHSITVEEALRAYTASPPRAVHQEHRLGTLETGKLADIVVLDNDPFTVPPTRLAQVKAAMTIVGGKVVYDSSK